MKQHGNSVGSQKQPNFYMVRKNIILIFIAGATFTCIFYFRVDENACNKSISVFQSENLLSVILA